MRTNVFKLSAVTATIMASFGGQAAVYNVYHYEPVNSSAKTYGVTIEDPAVAVDCWDGTDCQLSESTSHKIAIEERRFAAGFNYRDESPFFYELGFKLLAKGKEGFETYCEDFLRYESESCKRWVTENYTYGYALEAGGDNANTTAYIQTTQVKNTEQNVIINNVSPLIGSQYGGAFDARTIAFSGGNDPLDTTGFTQSKAWAVSDSGTLTVGSVSKQSSKSNHLVSQAAVWSNNTLNLVANAGSESGDSMPQGSARGITPDGSFAVGYNSTAAEFPVAAVFDLADLANIQTKFVSAYNDDGKYLNSILTSVNSNNIAIGTVKYRESNDGAYSNSLFYVPDVAAGSLATSSFSGGIFFKSANGKAGAINNKNEVVGQIDYERGDEKGGKPRAQRAFVTVVGDRSQSKAPFRNGAYYLDDLTLGNSNNNKYRIIDATDINDSSVISGTAYYCANGYDSDAINATCDDGRNGAEKIVAVKLVPIEGATAADITSRPVEESSVKRKGGSLGWFALGLLALLGFRRKQ